MSAARAVPVSPRCSRALRSAVVLLGMLAAAAVALAAPVAPYGGTQPLIRPAAPGFARETIPAGTRAITAAELERLRASGYPHAPADPSALRAPSRPSADGPGRSPYGVLALPCGAIDNCSFETGTFDKWISTDLAVPFESADIHAAGTFSVFFTNSPADGVFSYGNGFDGSGPGAITLAQDVILPPDAAQLQFDFRAAWSIFGTLSRTFSVEIQPSGGGAPLAAAVIATAPGGTTNSDTGHLPGVFPVAGFAGQAVRVVFRWDVPENFSGPAQFELDKITITESICGPIANCSFETGSTSSWTLTDFATPFYTAGVGGPGITPGFGLFTSAPTDGGSALLLGFDAGSPGDLTLVQDVLLPPGALSVEFDYRAGWDMVTFAGSTLPRSFRVEVQPSGGGVPMSSQTVLTAPAATKVLDTGPRTKIIDVSAFAGSAVRLAFIWHVPQVFTGPGFFQLDRVRLSNSVCGGISNCSFETGSLPGWTASEIASPFYPQHVGSAGEVVGFGLFTTAPSNGSRAFILGFDGGGPSTGVLMQDVTMPVWAERLRFDYRAGWDMQLVSSSTRARVFRFAVEPSGGGAPLYNETILVAPPHTKVLDTGPVTRSIDVSAFAGLDVRLVFRWDIPENFTGPGLFQLDHVALNGSLLSAPGAGAARTLSLMPATPNPARAATTFRFTLPATGDVELEVVDVRGARVWYEHRTAVAAGEHAIAWDGRGADGRDAAAGVYFARVRTHDAGSSRMFVRVR